MILDCEKLLEQTEIGDVVVQYDVVDIQEDGSAPSAASGSYYKILRNAKLSNIAALPLEDPDIMQVDYFANTDLFAVYLYANYTIVLRFRVIKDIVKHSPELYMELLDALNEGRSIDAYTYSIGELIK